jgi:hypothetical protein
MSNKLIVFCFILSISFLSRAEEIPSSQERLSDNKIQEKQNSPSSLTADSPVITSQDESAVTSQGNDNNDISYAEVRDLYEAVSAKKKSELEQKQEDDKKSDEKDVEAGPSYMDELYSPLVPKGKFLSRTEYDYFYSHAYGTHGAAAYGKVVNGADFYALKESIKFSPLSNLEIGLGYGSVLPFSFRRDAYYPDTDAVRISSDNKTNYLNDYILTVRARLQSVELYLDAAEKKQRGKRNTYNEDSPFLSYHNYYVDYYDIKAGLRYVSGPQTVVDESNLSKITEPLLAQKQLSAEAEIGYKKGKAKTTISYQGASYDNASEYTDVSHFIPKVNLSYGLLNNLEIESGLYYTTPYKYDYKISIYYTDGTYTVTNAAYRLKNNFTVPFGVYWRPAGNTEISFLSDFNYAEQNIDYYSRTGAGVVTDYPLKKLAYFNTDPTLRFTYLNDMGKVIEKDEFSSLTKTLLLKSQYKIDFEFKKDITCLKKGSTGGTQNIVDPYNVFLWPVEESVTDTEYAAMYAGNATHFATNISAQNYYQLKGAFLYGITDKINMGLTLGYHSASALHFFDIPGLRNNFYKFKPYYFIDSSFDWRITKNSMFSFGSHFVPRYTVFRDYNNPSGSYPKTAKGESRYYTLSAEYDVLF